MPSMMVVSSLLATTRRARPRSADGGVLELEADVLGDEGAAGEDGDVFEDRLAAVAEAGGLHREDVQRAAELVDDEGGEGFAFEVVGDDDDVLRDLEDLLEEREELLDGGDLLIGDDDVGVFDDRFHAVGVGHEVGRDVAAVELEAVDELRFELDAAGFLDGDDAVLAHLLHDVGDEFADLLIVGGDGGDVGDLLLGEDGLRLGAEVFDGGLEGRFDAALDHHRVVAGGDDLHAGVDERLGEDGGGGGAVAGDVVRLGRHLLGQLGAHVLEGVFELDFAGDGDAVLGDVGGAVLLIEDDVAAAGAEGDFDRIGERVDAVAQAPACGFIEEQLLGNHRETPFLARRGASAAGGCLCCAPLAVSND
jgi:hypothetical protein